MIKFIIAAALFSTSCLSYGHKQNPVCNTAIEKAYQLIEYAIKTKPAIAYAPVRNHTDSQLFRQACLKGFQSGKSHNHQQLSSMIQELEAKSKQPGMSPEEARYLINDMAMVLAYKVGYQAGVK